MNASEPLSLLENVLIDLMKNAVFLYESILLSFCSLPIDAV